MQSLSLLRGYPSTLRELTFYSYGCDGFKMRGGGVRVRRPSQVDDGCQEFKLMQCTKRNRISNFSILLTKYFYNQALLIITLIKRSLFLQATSRPHGQKKFDRILRVCVESKSFSFGYLNVSLVGEQLLLFIYIQFNILMQ